MTDERTLLQSYREEIEELKRQLKEAKEVGSKANSELPVETPARATPRVQRTQSEVGLSSSDEEEDLGDADVLVSAIANLESLILKAGASSRSTRKLNSGGVTVTGGIEGDGALASSRALDDALMKAEEKMELGSSNANTRQPLSELNVLSPTPMSASSSNYSPLTSPPKITAQHDSEGDNDQNNTHLLQELHRIQGMLGTVMKQKKRKGGGGHKSPQRDADVERLQEALVVSTMRKADSSFLQSQLNMKEG